MALVAARAILGRGPSVHRARRPPTRTGLHAMAATPIDDTSVPASGVEPESELRWQRNLLPVMVGALAVLGAFFVIESVLQVRRLETYITDEHGTAVSMVVGDTIAATASRAQVEAHQFRVLTSLELYSIDRRYHQTNLLLMSRVWTRYMGFVTGMVLALIGAVFVLGK